jgi:hypothetical protein
MKGELGSNRCPTHVNTLCHHLDLAASTIRFSQSRIPLITILVPEHEHIVHIR